MIVKIRCPKIIIPKIATKVDPDNGDLTTTLTIETILEPGTHARILNLLKQRVPFYFELGSDQAVFDLEAIGFKDPKAIEAFAKIVADQAKEAVPA